MRYTRIALAALLALGLAACSGGGKLDAGSTPTPAAGTPSALASAAPATLTPAPPPAPSLTPNAFFDPARWGADPAVQVTERFLRLEVQVLRTRNLRHPEVIEVTTPAGRSMLQSVLDAMRSTKTHFVGTPQIKVVGVRAEGNATTVQMCERDKASYFAYADGRSSRKLTSGWIPLQVSLLLQEGSWKVSGQIATAPYSCKGVR